MAPINSSMDQGRRPAAIDVNSDAFRSSAYLKVLVPMRADLPCRSTSSRIVSPLNARVQFIFRDTTRCRGFLKRTGASCARQSLQRFLYLLCMQRSERSPAAFLHLFSLQRTSRLQVQQSAVRNNAAPMRRPVRDSGRNSVSGPGDATPAAGSIRRTLKVRALPLRCRE